MPSPSIERSTVRPRHKAHRGLKQSFVCARREFHSLHNVCKMIKSEEAVTRLAALAQIRFDHLLPVVTR
jgi:hypothetical protein